MHVPRDKKMPKPVAVFFRKQLRLARKVGLKLTTEWAPGGTWLRGYECSGLVGKCEVDLQLSWDLRNSSKGAMFYIHLTGASETSSGCVCRVDLLASGGIKDVWPNRLADLVLLGQLV